MTPLRSGAKPFKDDQHPRHRASWLLFTKSMNAKGAAKLLAEQKETVIPWLYETLDTEDLYLENSLGEAMRRSMLANFLENGRLSRPHPACGGSLKKKSRMKLLTARLQQRLKSSVLLFSILCWSAASVFTENWNSTLPLFSVRLGEATRVHLTMFAASSNVKKKVMKSRWRVN